MGDWVLKLALSALFSGLIGIERQFHGRPAGLRTHMLVGLGSTLITLSGLSLTGNGGMLDIGRIVAGIVTGIGFLGAGAIVRTQDMIRGLTTAACIWFVAAVGVVTALSLYLLAAAATGTVLVILILLALLEDLIPSLSYRDIMVSGKGRPLDGIVEDCCSLLTGAGMKVIDYQIEYGPENLDSRLLFHTRTRREVDRIRLVRALSSVDGVDELTWQRQQETL
jgi:putative Mg2+ transporter-C (MgtC) family protein